MPAHRPGKTRSRRTQSGASGQAVLEYALSALVMATLAFGVVDFSRAIYQQQTITSLAAQGANLAMRGTDLGVTANSLVSQSNLNMGTNGCVYVSAVYANSPTALTVTAQGHNCGITASSKVGVVNGTAHIPGTAIPPTNQTVYVAEVFYKYQPITPIGKLVHFVLPSQLYDVAYY